ncbi:MAG TPA: YybS family protein [Methylomusa anaerophila]|uniref:DUF2232 domain-containing protein n=1 Tax=Methylomusa anaerophila TaxID=1930071 RepID=A0A348AHS0_9FIRM|nr:YybS family protein [Methylomusa anaerophila]BBB90618.1 hypothetical protein MAMMFC1_01272 [Methylomusa anaerophila]HML88775.1 YybS family protein [Methylomusa anaerophila]
MRQTNVRPVVEGGILTAVAIIFGLISTYLPILGPFVNLIWPVPLILLGVRHGYKWSILATVAAGIIIALLMHPLAAVTVVVGFGLIGIVLGHALRQGYSPFYTLLAGSAASLLSKVAVLVIGAAVLGFNPLNMQIEAMGNAIDQVLAFYRSMGLSEEELSRMDSILRPMIDLMKIILPASFVIASVVDTYLNYHVARIVLKKLGHTVGAFPPFKYWVMPRQTIYALAVAMVMIYWGQSREISLLYQAGMNLQVLTIMVLLLQGLALFYYLADKYNLSRLARGIILVLIFSNGFFTQGLIFAGVFDLIFDYRRLRQPRTD